MAPNGRAMVERLENWKDALRLFSAVLENDIGRQNYVAWFNIGFLRWKHLNDPSAAEQAFFNAQRTAPPSAISGTPRAFATWRKCSIYRDTSRTPTRRPIVRSPANENTKPCSTGLATLRKANARKRWLCVACSLLEL